MWGSLFEIIAPRADSSFMIANDGLSRGSSTLRLSATPQNRHLTALYRLALIVAELGEPLHDVVRHVRV